MHDYFEFVCKTLFSCQRQSPSQAAKITDAGTKGKLSLFEALKFREKCFFLVKNLLARLCNRKAEVILSSTIKTAIRLAVAFTAS